MDTLKVEHDLDRPLTSCNSCVHAASNLAEGSLYSDWWCARPESLHIVVQIGQIVYISLLRCFNRLDDKWLSDNLNLNLQCGTSGSKSDYTNTVVFQRNQHCVNSFGEGLEVTDFFFFYMKKVPQIYISKLTINQV